MNKSKTQPKPPMPPELAEQFKKLISGGGLLEMTNMFADMDARAKESVDSGLRQEQWLLNINNHLVKANGLLSNINFNIDRLIGVLQKP